MISQPGNSTQPQITPNQILPNQLLNEQQKPNHSMSSNVLPTNLLINNGFKPSFVNTMPNIQPGPSETTTKRATNEQTKPIQHSTELIRDLTNKLNHSNGDQAKLADGDPTKSLASSTQSALYSNISKVCQWPDCANNSTKFDSFYEFYHSHLAKEHRLDDKSHAQVLKQIHAIEALETELAKHKQLLNEMLHHLNSQLVALKQQQQQHEIALNLNFSQPNLTILQQQQKQQPLTNQNLATSQNPIFLAAAIAAAQQQQQIKLTEESTFNKENKSSALNSDNAKISQTSQVPNGSSAHLSCNNLSVATNNPTNNNNSQPQFQLVNNNHSNINPNNNHSNGNYHQRRQGDKSPLSLGDGETLFLLYLFT